MSRTYDKGDKVMTPQGPGTIVYKRMAPPSFSEVEVYSVALADRVAASAKPPFPTYAGTIYRPQDLSDLPTDAS